MNVFEKSTQHFLSQLPFVLFCKPYSNKIVGVFQRTDELNELNDFKESGFAFVSFDATKKYYLPINECDVIVQTNSENEYHVSKNQIDNIDFEAKNQFVKLVTIAIKSIKKGDFNKVVISRKEVVDLEDNEISSILKKLIFNYKTAFNYCFFHPKVGLWMGATPEQFIKIESSVLKTVALAGTQIFSNEVLWKSKEKEEQQFVTDFILNTLKKFSDEVFVTNPTTIQAGNLMHLKTDITAVISKNDLESIIHNLHPTPAVCGLPKETSKEFLVSNEGYNREFYSGFLGELNIDFTTYKTDNSDLFVNLRCMKVDGKKATLYVGCGITKDSNPESEFIETVNKSLTIKKVLL